MNKKQVDEIERYMQQHVKDSAHDRHYAVAAAQ